MKYLIVDDHALITGALSLMLEDRDPEAEVHTAATAREARRVRHRPLIAQITGGSPAGESF